MAEKLSGKSNSSGVTTIPALIFHIHWRGKGEALTAFPARRDIRRPPPDFCALTFFISLAQDGCIQKSVSALCTPYEHVCMCGKRTERHREALGVSTVSDFLFRPQQPCSVCLARLRVGGYGCFAWRLSALFGSSAPWERLMGFFNRRLTFGPQNEKKKFVCSLNTSRCLNLDHHGGRSPSRFFCTALSLKEQNWISSEQQHHYTVVKLLVTASSASSASFN